MTRQASVVTIKRKKLFISRLGGKKLYYFTIYLNPIKQISMLKHLL